MTEAPQDGLARHREWLLRAEHTASRDFDKALMTLSAGALGISLLFIRNVAPRPSHICWLVWAWVLFGLSLVFVLTSLVMSGAALRVATRQLDQGRHETEYPGGWAGRTTLVLNVAAAITFVIGVFFLMVFALLNISSKGG